MAVSGRKLVIALSVLGLAGVAAILLAFRAIGSGNFARASIVAEGRIDAVELARGVAACAAGRELPPSSAPVPHDASAVASGRTYTASPADFTEAAFVCAKFARAGALHFQIAWRRDDARVGRAVVDADLDGDGRIDRQIRVGVTCDGTRCDPGAIEEGSP